MMPRVSRVESKVFSTLEAHSSAKVSGWSFGLECDSCVLGIKGHKSSASIGIRGVCCKGTLFSVRSKCMFCGKNEDFDIPDALLEQFAMTQGRTGGDVLKADAYDITQIIANAKEELKAEMHGTG